MSPKTTDQTAIIEARLNRLPDSLSRGRIIDAKLAAAYWGVSLTHWRRLYRSGLVPTPMRVGERKYGWRLSDLAAALEARAVKAA